MRKWLPIVSTGKYKDSDIVKQVVDNEKSAKMIHAVCKRWRIYCLLACLSYLCLIRIAVQIVLTTSICGHVARVCLYANCSVMPCNS